MKIQDLEAKIAIKADAAVQARIREFKRNFDAALNTLFDTPSGIGGHQFGSYGKFEGRSNEENCQSGCNKLSILKLAINDMLPDDDKTKQRKSAPWPSTLWQAERDKIRAELLEKMDLMARLIATTDRTSDGDVPEEVSAAS